MEITLSDAMFIHELLAYLEEEGFVVVETGSGTLKASPAPGSFRQDHVRMELELRLAIWRACHPGIETNLAL